MRDDSWNQKQKAKAHKGKRKKGSFYSCCWLCFDIIILQVNGSNSTVVRTREGAHLLAPTLPILVFSFDFKVKSSELYSNSFVVYVSQGLARI